MALHVGGVFREEADEDSSGAQQGQGDRDGFARQSGTPGASHREPRRRGERNAGNVGNAAAAEHGDGGRGENRTPPNASPSERAGVDQIPQRMQMHRPPPAGLNLAADVSEQPPYARTRINQRPALGTTLETR